MSSSTFHGAPQGVKNMFGSFDGRNNFYQNGVVQPLLTGKKKKIIDKFFLNLNPKICVTCILTTRQKTI